MHATSEQLDSLAPTRPAAWRDRAPGHAVAVRQMFDRISPTYDVLNRLLSWGIDRRWRARALDVLARDLPEGPLLDSCAGTLDLSAAMAERLPGRAIVATDFARDMLRLGRRKALDTVCPVLGDAMRLPFASQRFAGVVCGFGMRNLADLREGVAEAHRLLAPGGTLVVLEFFRPTRFVTRAFHAFYARWLLPLVGGLVSRDAQAYGYLSRSMRDFVTRVEMERVLGDVGFGDVSGEDLTFGVASIVAGKKRSPGERASGPEARGGGT